MRQLTGQWQHPWLWTVVMLCFPSPKGGTQNSCPPGDATSSKDNKEQKHLQRASFRKASRLELREEWGPCFHFPTCVCLPASPFSHSLRVHMCVWLHACVVYVVVHVQRAWLCFHTWVCWPCLHIGIKARGGHWVSFTITFHLILRNRDSLIG